MPFAANVYIVKNVSRDKLIRTLRESRKERGRLQSQLDRIVSISAGIIYILDPDGRFVFVNSAVEDILHYEPDELIGRHFSVIMPPDEFTRVGRGAVLPKLLGSTTGSESSPKLFDERRTGQRKTKNLEVQLISKSQKGIRLTTGDVTGIIAVEGVYDRGLRVKSKAAGFIGSQGLIVDITGYKRAQKERLGIHRRLLELQKMDAIGRLAEGIGHDFNNKLGTILGCAEMIKQHYTTSAAELDACIDPVISASRHAAELAAKLLQFGRKGPVVEENVSVHALVRDMALLLDHTVDKRISIRCSLYAEPPVVRGDSRLMQSALLNLVMNSCDAMPHGGTLGFETDVRDNDAGFKMAHASAKDAGRYVRISVADTGEGMDAETKSRMFEPFFTTKTDGASMGMGLTSVMKLVRTHRGFIEVESEPGAGTKIHLFLPCAGFESEALPAASGEDRVLKGTGRILVVDDEISFLGVLKHVLEDLGYGVVACSCDTDAVEYYRRHRDVIDCVIIDVAMPGLSGRECLREMRKINPAVKAIVSTGYGLNSEVKAMLKDGALDFIHKPFDNAKLSQVVSQVLSRGLAYG